MKVRYLSLIVLVPLLFCCTKPENNDNNKPEEQEQGQTTPVDPDPEDELDPQVKDGDVILVTDAMVEKFLTEVKGCTLAADLKRGIGLFPDAPTERGVKHLDELAAAAKKGYHCTIAFVIQMNGIHMVFPNNDTHPEFGKALIRAANAGVQVVYYGCHVEADSIIITGNVDDTGRYAKQRLLTGSAVFSEETE